MLWQPSVSWKPLFTRERLGSAENLVLVPETLVDRTTKAIIALSMRSKLNHNTVVTKTKVETSCWFLFIFPPHSSLDL